MFVGPVATGPYVRMRSAKKRKKKKSLSAELAACRKKLARLESERASKFAALSSVSRTVASDMYIEEILSLLMRITAELMNSKICSLMLLDEDRQELVLRASQSLSKDYLEKGNIKVGESVSGKVVKSKKPIVVENVRKDKLYNYPDIARKEGLYSLLSVPLLFKGRVIGVINSYKDHIHRFSEEEINLLSSVANQAAVAIQNTTLLADKKDLEEKLEARKLVEKAKGILMKLLAVDEDSAYRMLQKQSMDKRKSMKEIANAIIISKELERKQ